MPKYFLTKVWGYDPPSWPVLGFGTVGGVNKLQREYATADWVVLLGTKAEPTVVEDRGRLLGMVQVKNTVVDVEKLLRSLGTPFSPEVFKDGAFRWPKGFPFLAAKSFVDKPLLENVFPNGQRDTARAEAAYAIELTDQQVELISVLAVKEVEFRVADILDSAVRMASLLVGTGPEPSMGTRESVYLDGENIVYIFKIEGSNFYKIGRSNDLDRRLREFNSSPHAIWSGKQMSLVGSQPFANASSAHDVEQIMHKNLSKFSVASECYCVAKEEIVTVALANAMVEYCQTTSD